MPVQFITTPSGDQLAILPRAEYERLASVAAEAADDAADIQTANAILARVSRGEEEVFPAAVVNALLDGANPVRLLREYRGMTLKDLAVAAGVDYDDVLRIEHGEDAGSISIVKALAQALRVDMDMLTG